MFLFSAMLSCESDRTQKANMGGAQALSDATSFELYAPNASQVYLELDGQYHRMDGPHEGKWYASLPWVAEGGQYRYQVRDQWGNDHYRADPFAFANRGGYSVVSKLDRFQWNDHPWMMSRQKERLNIYECHLGSRNRHEDGSYFSYDELASVLIEHCQYMKYSHVELMGLFEHSSDDSMGYQVTGFYAPTSRYGTLYDFQHFVNRLHHAGIGVIVDCPYFHFSIDEHGLYNFDGSNVYGEMDSQWGTKIFKFDDDYVKSFLKGSALFLVEELHVDGLRFDAVSEIAAHGGETFLRELNYELHQRAPGIFTIAEDSRYEAIEIEGDRCLGFDFKFNMGGIKSLMEVYETPLYRRSSQYEKVQEVFNQALGRRMVLGHCHDEAHYKSLFDRFEGYAWQKHKHVMLFHAIKAFGPWEGLNFMNDEYGCWDAWKPSNVTHWKELEIDEHQKTLRAVKAIHELGQDSVFSYQSRFEWLDTSHADKSLLAYLRTDSQGRSFTVIHHFDEGSYKDFNIHFDTREAMSSIHEVRELFNTDRSEFGGMGFLTNHNISLLHNNKGSYGMCLKIPPLSTIVLQNFS